MRFSALGLSTLLSLALLLSPPALASKQTHLYRRKHHDLSTPQSKTAHLLHCLGHHEIGHADRTKIASLIESNPNPSDDSVWSQLSPKTWGFQGHDVPGGDTWTPVPGAAQTIKDKVARQHSKLVLCGKKLQQDVVAQQESKVQPEARLFWPGTQLVQDWTKGFAAVDKGYEGWLVPGSQPASAAVNSPQAIPEGTAVDIGANKQAPGLGPDEKSSAPALENDPGLKMMPKPADGAVLSPPAVAAAAGGATGAATDATGAGAGTAGSTNLSATGSTPGVVADDASTGMTEATLLATSSAGAKAASPPAAGQAVGAGAGAATGGLGSVVLATNATNTTQPQDAQAPIPGQLKLGQVTDPLATTQTQDLTVTPQTQDVTVAGDSPGNCTNPLIRKEYSTLTASEKKAYSDAMKCVRAKPSRFRTGAEWNRADDWALLHIRMLKYVHFTAYFLVFHRGFTAVVERDLNECGWKLGLPWVDWTKTAQDPSTNAIFDSSPAYGLGSNGHGNSTDCPWQSGLVVSDGSLADHWFNAPFRHKLCRQFNNMNVHQPNPHMGSNCTTFINANFVKGLGTTHDNGKYFDFSSAVEISAHLAMHTCVGGNLAWLSTSPNEPVFHSHHGFVDNIYASWQNKSEENKWSFHGPKEQQKFGKHPPWTAQRTDEINFSPMAENVKVEDLLDTQSGKWGGRMCYRYDYNLEL